MRIHAKVNSWLGAFSLFFWVVISLALYGYFKSEATQEAEKQCGMILAQAVATQDYVREELRPVMYGLVPDDVFIPEAMSTTFITRSVLERFQEQYPDYRFKFAATDPRNALNLANDVEEGIINEFKANPDAEVWRGIVEWEGKPYLTVAAPIRYDDSCMKCHGAPQDAPTMLVERYGDGGGFSMAAGDVAIRSVGVPIGASLAAARIKALQYSGFTGFFLLTLFALTSLLIRRLGTKPLERLRDGAERVGRGELNFRLDIRSRDEIGELGGAFNAMAERIEESHVILERRVAERTEELDERIKQLEVFNKSMVGRELRMVGLKNEVNRLLSRLGEEPMYDVDDKIGMVEVGRD